jgi:hypothetical protein
MIILVGGKESDTHFGSTRAIGDRWNVIGSAGKENTGENRQENRE